MAKLVVFCLLSVLACIAGQRITTIQLDGVQYFISRMNPYSPELNYFLAYQYCRSLGLQLASFETKEKVESMTQYLQNAGYSKYDFWTSGNRLGTGMFLWMSTGLPFNATFDYFENSEDSVNAGLLDPVDHNSNTSPQRTARDSNSGLEKGCVVLKAPNLRWTPEDCSIVKDFICEQTRCYYYNYGSIPVSSAQGRPITSTTTHEPFISTTPLPFLMSSTYASIMKKPEREVNPEDVSEPTLESLKLAHEKIEPITNTNKLEETVESTKKNHDSHTDHDTDDSDNIHEESGHDDDTSDENIDEDLDQEEEEKLDDEEQESSRTLHDEEKETETEQHIDVEDQHVDPQIVEPSVEQRLKQISKEIEKLSSSETSSPDDLGRQSFFSLSDLIKTLRPNDKKTPQIDSDYSNTMHVLGETSSIIGNEESRKFNKDVETQTPQINRALN